MPGGDRTGPQGYGPMTGRRLGYCSGYDSPGFAKGMPRGRGFGRGWGRGYGLGWRNRRRFFYRDEPYYEPAPIPYYRQTNPESSKEEKVYLENLVKDLEEELKAAKDRIQQLSKEKKETQ